ncbi:hypothetical protein M0802_015400 [Mischocyttarus mexicanus]|nr:hypothetical protein M0802_015400 [Mischocyttarus mexicanus]
MKPRENKRINRRDDDGKEIERDIYIYIYINVEGKEESHRKTSIRRPSIGYPAHGWFSLLYQEFIPVAGAPTATPTNSRA